MVEDEGVRRPLLRERCLTVRHVCHCSCHAEERADHREALHEGSDWPRVFALAQKARYVTPEADAETDAIAAVLACSACVNGHCDVLLIRVIWGPLPYSTPEPAGFATDGAETD